MKLTYADIFQAGHVPLVGVRSDLYVEDVARYHVGAGTLTCNALAKYLESDVGDTSYSDVHLKIGYYDIDECYIENGITYGDAVDVIQAFKGKILSESEGSIQASFWTYAGKNPWLTSVVTIAKNDMSFIPVRDMANMTGYGDKISFSTANGPDVFVAVDNEPLPSVTEAAIEVLKFADDLSNASMASGFPVFMGVGGCYKITRIGGKIVTKELIAIEKALLPAEARAAAFAGGLSGEKMLAQIIGSSGIPQKYFPT